MTARETCGTTIWEKKSIKTPKSKNKTACNKIKTVIK